MWASIEGDSYYVALCIVDHAVAELCAVGMLVSTNEAWCWVASTLVEACFVPYDLASSTVDMHSLSFVTFLFVF